MDLPEGIEWPEEVLKYAKEKDGPTGGYPTVSGVLGQLEKADTAIATLIDMVRRFYWQRDELLRLSTAYPAVMKEKLEADWEKRR